MCLTFRMQCAGLTSVLASIYTMTIDEVATNAGRSSVCPATCIFRRGMSKIEAMADAVIRTTVEARSPTNEGVGMRNLHCFNSDFNWMRYRRIPVHQDRQLNKSTVVILRRGGWQCQPKRVTETSWRRYARQRRASLACAGMCLVSGLTSRLNSLTAHCK